MQMCNIKNFCMTDFPCVVKFLGIGKFVSSEWGFKGFKLPHNDAFEKLGDEHPVILSLNDEGTFSTKAVVRMKHDHAGEACFHFVEIGPSQRIYLFSMVIAASAFKIAHSRN